MKKFIFGFFAILIISTCVFVLADDSGYSLEFDANQAVFKNVPIKVDVKLVGKDAPTKSNVRVKAEVSGPARPKLMATDSNNREWDIAEIGYWGPDEGFPVTGTFTNTTEVTATFPEAGLYEIKLSLIDVTASTTITTTTSSIYVYKDEEEYNQINGEDEGNETGNNVINNVIGNAAVDIPKTGSSFGEYLVYSLIVIAIVGTVYIIIRNYRVG